MTYNEIIKKAGKRITKHVYYVLNGTTINVSDESVESVKFDTQTPLIGTSINGCELVLREPINGAIYVQIEARYGTYTATKTYGPFYLKEEPTYQAEKKTYLHKTYDGLLKSMVDYQSVSVSYPCTVFNFFEAIVSAVGYTTNIQSLPNGSQQMQVDIFENIGFTYRDVLDDIAVANGVLFYVDGNELKIATLGGNSITIDDDVLKNQNIEFGQHFGAINTIVLSRSGESDNIYYPTTLPENPIEFKIKDNQLMNDNNRADYLPALYNQLNGIEYDIYDTELTGWGDLIPLQSVSFETGDNTYNSYIFNNEITLTDGYKQAIYNDLPEETVTDYKAASTTDKTINQAYIIVRKNEAEIESLARRVVDVSETKIGTGSVTLENAYRGRLHYLSISGQISLLFPQNESNLYGYPLVPSNDLVPSDTLTPSSPVPYQNEISYPSSTLYSKSSILLIDSDEYMLDFDFLNYYSSTVYDEFIYEDGKCKIIRRVGIDSSGNKYALDNEVTEYRKDIDLFVNPNSTIQLKSFSNVTFNVNYLLENEYTENFTTEYETQSQIKQMSDSITSTVNANYATKKELEDTDVKLNSTIQQTANSITSTVSETYETKSNAQSNYSQIQQTTNSISQTVTNNNTKANIIAKINDNTSQAQIDADNIDLNATDVLNILAGNTINLTTKSIAINSTNFGVDTAGNITANSGTIGGWSISSDKLLSTSSEQKVTGMSSSTFAGDPVFFAGGNNPWNDSSWATSVPFYVTNQGKLKATNAEISGKIYLSDDVLNYWATGSFIIQSEQEQNRQSFMSSLAVVLKDNAKYSMLTANALDIYDEFGNTGRWQSIGANSMFIYDNKYVPCIALADGTTRTESNTVISSRNIITPVLTQTSLEKEKKNFEKLENGLDIIQNIDIYKYHLKNQSEKSKKHIGFVIGDNFKYSDEVTSLNNDGVDLYSFISVCCKAIQEQQEEIENLKKEMEELKNGFNTISK